MVEDEVEVAVVEAVDEPISATALRAVDGLAAFGRDKRGGGSATRTLESHGASHVKKAGLWCEPRPTELPAALFIRQARIRGHRVDIFGAENPAPCPRDQPWGGTSGPTAAGYKSSRSYKVHEQGKSP